MTKGQLPVQQQAVPHGTCVLAGQILQASVVEEDFQDILRRSGWIAQAHFRQ